jgi:hypothetical protein
MLVQRVLDRQRWWLKSLVWDDDRRSLFGRGHYLGDLRGSGDSYGNPEFCDPYFAELSVPRVRRLEAALAEVCPDWQEFKAMIDSSWLCAPKAFRYLERLLWSIGKGQPVAGEVPGFLQVDDTYPDHDSASRWWRGFLASLDAWWQDQPAEGPIATDVGRRLGDPSPVKRWLVRLLVRRLELLERHAEIARLVNPRPDRKRGRQRSPDA